jgi:hypothetical protein
VAFELARLAWRQVSRGPRTHIRVCMGRVIAGATRFAGMTALQPRPSDGHRRVRCKGTCSCREAAIRHVERDPELTLCLAHALSPHGSSELHGGILTLCRAARLVADRGPAAQAEALTHPAGKLRRVVAAWCAAGRPRREKYYAAERRIPWELNRDTVTPSALTSACQGWSISTKNARI